MKNAFILLFTCFCSISPTISQETEDNTWKSPPKEVLEVLNAPQLPWVWTSPTGDHFMLMDPRSYPPLSELAAPMYKLAGLRVNPKTNGSHNRYTATNPRIISIKDGKTTQLDFPKDLEIDYVLWTADGKRFALIVQYPDHSGLWIGDISGKVKRVENLALNTLMTTGASWLPDQKRLLLHTIPERGAPPTKPAIPAGPMITQSEGASARSTYEARNLLETDHDEALFEYHCTSELVIYDPEAGNRKTIGKPAIYSSTSWSPSGQYLMTRRLTGKWSHEVAYWRFGSEVEIWDANGKKVSTVASLPLADNVPTQGVPMGPRSITWQSTAPHTLFWVEALDGGDPTAKVDHRDKMMRLKEPFSGKAEEAFKAQHRITWGGGWLEEPGKYMLVQRQRIKRRRYVWILDVNTKKAEQWYEIDEADRYNDPGRPLYKILPNGKYVFRQEGDNLFFRGSGGTNEGDRPFLDQRNLKSGESERLFRCDPNKYENFIEFAGGKNQFIIRSESASEVPNFYLATFGKTIKAAEGEGTRAITKKPITTFADPTPQLRQIQKRIVKYERNDGVQLSFHLHLPPGYKEGDKLPTVVYAYPLEYSGASTAGQVRGSAQRFMRIGGASHMFFLLQGYAVLDRTSMPMIGDPETTYDTFVPQLVADAEAAVKKAVDMGIADPKRIGVIGHSHGGLMVANLLAHTDLFAAGIARSGSYNKTNQPYGFQAERRSLFDARDVYIQVSPTFFADKVNEPCLIIHGTDDSNPGTLTFQSEVFYEAVRGSGGTARLVLLPHEDHGYRSRESIEHVLWEQIKWFDKYVKNKE